MTGPPGFRKLMARRKKGSIIGVVYPDVTTGAGLIISFVSGEVHHSNDAPANNASTICFAAVSAGRNNPRKPYPVVSFRPFSALHRPCVPVAARFPDRQHTLLPDRLFAGSSYRSTDRLPHPFLSGEPARKCARPSGRFGRRQPVQGLDVMVEQKMMRVFPCRQFQQQFIQVKPVKQG